MPSQVSPTSALVAEHLPSSGITFHGYDTAGKGDKSGDPELVAILEKAKVERDTNARKKLVLEAQGLLAKLMPMLPEAGGATGFYAAWPALQNFEVYQSRQQVRLRHYWLDQTKAPFV